MNGLLEKRNATVLAVLVGTTLLAAGSVQAQDNPPHKAIGQTRSQLPPRNDDQPLAFDLTTGSILVDFFAGQADELLGATLQPAGDALRAQLAIPPGQGLLVTSLNGDGQSARAGLKQNDILLTLADKPLATTDDLIKQLKAAGELPLLLKVLRTGKPTEIQVRPIYRVTLGPVEERKTEYFIGVAINPVDDALRAQLELELPAGQGAIVNQVVSGSPAEKAGVKKYDVILELGGKPIDSPQALTSQVETLQDKPTTLKLLRAGKLMTLRITPGVRKVEVSPLQMKLRVLNVAPTPKFLEHIARLTAPSDRMLTPAPAATDDLRQRLDHLEKELKALHEELDRLNQAFKSGKTRKGE
jgi:membrane-associated protease RseP (regulator of RpoE activity)